MQAGVRLVAPVLWIDEMASAVAEALQAELWTAERGLRNAARQSWIHYIGPEINPEE